ncbi:MAG: orotidine-5'-phosphate decarboxylase [Candidatus Eiseniibacteriota bacterium]|nr:MAG: orotidine-5'-phosphate decarboxylase [Candidatus Eisenbacteria bacterium]
MHRDPAANLIVALDFPEQGQALSLANLLTPKVKFYKVGLELFVNSGPPVVTAIKEMGARVFLDLKFHDIPNTVKRAVACATRLGADIISIHLKMGAEGVRAASEGAEEASVSGGGGKPLIAGVTVLTSQGAAEPSEKTGSVLEEVLRLCRLARDCGVNGIITSVKEAGDVRRLLGPGCSIITPGIRLTAALDDHKRAGTVRDALDAGADYLVVGRPITRAPDPLRAAEEFLAQMKVFGSKP